MVFRGQLPGLQEHYRRILRVLGVIQRLIPKHPKRLDDFRVGAVAGVLQHLVVQVLPIHFVVRCVPQAGGLCVLGRLRPAENDNIPNTVKLLADGIVNPPVQLQLHEEVVHILELLCEDIVEHLDVRLASELLQGVLLDRLAVIKISHPAPPRSSSRRSQPVPWRKWSCSAGHSRPAWRPRRCW